MPRVVIEEFVVDDDNSEDGDTDQVGKPHNVVTHHDIDDVSKFRVFIHMFYQPIQFSKLETGKEKHFGLHEMSPLDGRANGLNKELTNELDETD